MSIQADVLLIVPPGLGQMASHHEATVGMGALVPAAEAWLYPPHTVAACAATARQAGLRVGVLDAAGARLSPGAALEQICACSPQTVLAVLVSEGTAHADESFLRMLRWACPDRKVLLFGPSAGFVAQPWLDAGLAQAALLGEPEWAFAAGVEVLAEGGLEGAIPAGRLQPQRYDATGLHILPGSDGLDALPFPAWDLVPWQPYGMASLLSGRGCASGCLYCAYTVAQGTDTRYRSLESVLAEWEWLARAVQPPYLLVRDPVFAQDRERVRRLCEGIAARSIAIRFGCESRPEHFDPDLLRLLRAAGCEDLKIGLESGDPTLLQRLGRVRGAADADAYLAQTLRVARACRELGMICRVFVMVGIPGEGTESLARTVRLLHSFPPETVVHARPYQAHPGVAVEGPSASVAPEVLAGLRQANQPPAPVWRQARWALARAARRATGSLLAGKGRDKTAGQAPDTARLPAEPAAASPRPAPTLRGRRAFLTGGNGFLGGYVAAALAEAGAEVVALVRPGSPLAALEGLPVQVVAGDLRQPSTWAGALRGCDLCLHVAALYAGPEQAAALYAVNTAATAALLAACAATGVRRVVHTSTVGTVGRPAPRGGLWPVGEPLPDENTPFNLWDRASHYVRSKYLGELIALSWAGIGLEVIVVKPTAPVGARDARPSPTGQRILDALRGVASPYPPGGINHIPVRDAAAGHVLAAALGAAGQSYILGHREGNLDHAAFLRLVAEAAGVPPLKPPRRPMAGGPLPPALTVDPSRAVRELGLPQSDLRTAFAEAVAWYRAQGRPGHE